MTTQSPHSDSITEGIRIRAQARYVPEKSNPEQNLYYYSYRIQMVNEGELPARLESRHWIIKDSFGNQKDVRGAGVVGEYPRLEPGGELYEYQSNCPLTTSWGTMEGFYYFRRDDGQRIEVRIGRFFLVPSSPAIYT